MAYRKFFHRFLKKLGGFFDFSWISWIFFYITIFSEYFQFLDGDNFFSLIAILNPSEMMLIYTADIILKQFWTGLLIGNPCDKWYRKSLYQVYSFIDVSHHITKIHQRTKIWKLRFFIEKLTFSILFFAENITNTFLKLFWLTENFFFNFWRS